MSDPWAAAQSAQAPQASTAPAGESQLADSYAGQESQLFSTGGSAFPSLFNKTHQLGTERTGIISKAPYDRQGVDFNTKSPKFWEDGNSGKGQRPVDYAVSKVTGKPNRPVMDTFLELSTQYAMDAAEAGAVGREEPYEGGDRVFVAGGADLKLLRDAIGDAAKRGIPIGKGADLVGKRLTVKRVGQKPNPGGNPSWVIAIRLDNGN